MDALASWLGSLGTGVLVAIAGALLAGWLGTRAVTWLKVPSREGASGYFVVAMGLAGAALGLIVGIIASRHFGPANGGSTLLALGVALGAHAALLLGIAGIVRLRADVPPTRDGVPLLLMVEASWPAGQADALRAAPGTPYVVIARDDGRTLRARQEGPLWRQAMRIEDDRVVLPGAVELATGRGHLTLLVHEGGDGGECGFTLPERPHTDARGERWSGWHQQGNPTWGTVPVGFAVRYRVQARDVPLHVEGVGDFTVHTFADALGVQRDAAGHAQRRASAHFNVLFAGQVLAAPDRTETGRATAGRVDAVAVLAGTSPALVLLTDARYGSGRCWLLRVVDRQPRFDDLGHARGSTLAAHWLPPAGQPAGIAPTPEPGTLDHVTFARPGLYQLAESLLDTRTHTARHFPNTRSGYVLDDVPPLSLAPDEQRIARIAHADGGPVMVELDLQDGTRRSVAIGDARAPGGDWLGVDTRWFEHHFTWVPEGEAGMRLARRDGMPPWPRQGRWLRGNGVGEYRLAPVAPTMLPVFVDFLVHTLGGELQPAADGGLGDSVAVDGGVLQVAQAGDELVLFMLDGPQARAHAHVLATAGARFDEELASGRHDAHFLPPAGNA